MSLGCSPRELISLATRTPTAYRQEDGRAQERDEPHSGVGIGNPGPVRRDEEIAGRASSSPPVTAAPFTAR